MNIKEIIKSYLIDNEYDGLHCPGECNCIIDDLMSCEKPYDICEPGHLNDFYRFFADEVS